LESGKSLRLMKESTLRTGELVMANLDAQYADFVKASQHNRAEEKKSREQAELMEAAAKGIRELMRQADLKNGEAEKEETVEDPALG
jgi:hypothetical protein